MKKIITFVLFTIAICIGLIACGGSANAGTLTQNFVADDGKIFAVQYALSVEKVPNAVLVTSGNGTTYSYSDATGALYTKVLNSPGFGSHYVQVAGTLLYMNTADIVQVLCYSGGTQTVFTYPQGTAQARFFNDNCGLYNQVKAASN